MKNHPIYHPFTKLILALMFAFPSIASAVTVDVMFLYDDHSNDFFKGSPSTAAYSWVNQANGFYKASGVDIQMRVVGVKNFNIEGNDMKAVLDTYTKDSWVRQQRKETGADIVAFIHKTGKCGIGYQSVHTDWAYLVIGPNCGGARVFAHEAGHNMGLAHSRAQGNTGGVRYKYALGHVVKNVFGTIMTYPWLYSAKSALVFSNPRIKCSDLPCGVPEGESEQADAAKALNNVRTDVSNYTKSTLAEEPYSYCASENQTCDVSGTNLVRYGAGSHFNYQLLKDETVNCNSDSFGSDPIPGTFKTCDNIKADQLSYTTCSNEQQTCSFFGTRVIRYGANGKYHYKLASSSISCNNSVFGDPINGTIKTCSYSNAVDDPFEFCADEGGNCSVKGTKLVRYGAKSNFNYRLATDDTVACNNATFGDPINGTEKSCDSVGADQISYTECSDELEDCSFFGKRVVRYGADGSYAYKIATESTACSNAAFGVDPLRHTVKSCSYSDAL